MKHKLFISVLLISILIPAISLPVDAQVNTFSDTKKETISTGSSQRQAQRMTMAKERADQEIDRRIKTLNNLLTRISSMKKLSADQVAKFTTQIRSEITNLTNLKAKIDADTDSKTLQEDKKSIVDSYRIFALFIPQLSLIVAVDRLEVVADRLTNLSTKLQSRIQQVQTAGNDVTALQTAYTDLQAKITDAKTQYDAIITEVIPLTPQDYPGNKAILVDARSKLKTATSDLETAYQDIKTITSGLKTLRKNSVTPPPTSTSATFPAVMTTQQPQ